MDDLQRALFGNFGENVGKRLGRFVQQVGVFLDGMFGLEVLLHKEIELPDQVNLLDFQFRNMHLGFVEARTEDDKPFQHHLEHFQLEVVLGLHFNFKGPPQGFEFFDFILGNLKKGQLIGSIKQEPLATHLTVVVLDTIELPIELDYPGKLKLIEFDPMEYRQAQDRIAVQDQSSALKGHFCFFSFDPDKKQWMPQVGVECQLTAVGIFHELDKFPVFSQVLHWIS
jgi:hypothetical protein